MPPPGTIVAHAPCRVDLAGGTLDLWPLYLFHPGAVTVNFAVNILTRCKITRLTDDKIRLRSLDTKVEEEETQLTLLTEIRDLLAENGASGKHGAEVTLETSKATKPGKA